MKMDSNNSPKVQQVIPERKRNIGCGVLLFILALGVLSSFIKGGLDSEGLLVSVSTDSIFLLSIIGFLLSAPLIYLGIRLIKAKKRRSPLIKWINGLLIVLGMPMAAIIIIDAVCGCLFSGFGSLGSAAFKVFGGMIIVAFAGLLACHREIILEYTEHVNENETLTWIN